VKMRFRSHLSRIQGGKLNIAELVSANRQEIGARVGGEEQQRKETAGKRKIIISLLPV
jgi:hypothetical protein